MSTALAIHGSNHAPLAREVAAALKRTSLGALFDKCFGSLDNLTDQQIMYVLPLFACRPVIAHCSLCLSLTQGSSGTA